MRLWQAFIKKCYVRIFIAAPLVIGYSLALADDPDAVIEISCDKKNNFFLIKQTWEQAPDNAPYPRKIGPRDMRISVRGLTWAKESPEGVVTWHSKTIHRLCQLGNTTYTAILNGSKFNSNIQGMCGGGSPTLSLTLLQGMKVITPDLVFDHACHTSPNIIRSIRLEPLRHEAVVSLYDDVTLSTKDIDVLLDVPITRKRLFDEN
jgi:hypothetical protein